MILTLIILNIILIIIILFLFFSNYNKNTLFSNFENIELLEFQKGLKELIDELNKITNDGIKELDSKKKEIENSIVLIDSKIKELKYLIERNQVIRETEYKKEISYGNANNAKFIEKEETADITNITKKQKSDQKNIIESTKNAEKKSLKILIDENKDDKLNNLHLKHSQIQNLFKSGISIEEISKITGLTKGEIELIKNIKKQ